MTAGKITIKTSKHFSYTVYENGEVTKTYLGELERETPLNQYTDDDGVFVWIGKGKYYIKSLVARNFLKDEYRRGCVIEHIDGNPENCAVSNLRCVKRDNSGDSKIYTKVSVDGIEYDSIAAAERALFVSQGYLTKYFKGQREGKVLEGHDIRLVKE